MIKQLFEHQGITLNDTETWLDYKKPYASVNFYWESDTDAEFNLALDLSFTVEVDVLPVAVESNEIDGSDLCVRNVFINDVSTAHLLSDESQIFSRINNDTDLLQRFAECIQKYNGIYQEELAEQLAEDEAYALEEIRRERAEYDREVAHKERSKGL